jgi:hypothetical protein
MTNLKTTIRQDPRIKRSLDALYYSRELLKYNYNQLYQQYSSLSYEPKKLKRQIIPVLSSVWAVLDHVYKIREIARAIPGLSHQDKQRKEYLRKTEGVEILRHYNQHLQNRLAKNEIDNFPVFGSISWVDQIDPKFYYIAYYGNYRTAKNYGNMGLYGGAFNVESRKWHSRICLAIEGARFDIDPLYMDTNGFVERILNWIRLTYINQLDEPDRTYVMTLEMDINKGLIFNK